VDVEGEQQRDASLRVKRYDACMDAAAAAAHAVQRKLRAGGAGLH
jgi:hypothetical protein